MVMNKSFAVYLAVALLLLAPLSVFSFSSDPMVLTYNLFRLFGLYAFTLILVQVTFCSFREPLRDILGAAEWYGFHHNAGKIAFILALAHPTTLLVYSYLSHDFSFYKSIVSFSSGYFFYSLGPVALYLLVIVLITVFFFKTRMWGDLPLWRRLHTLNYLIFIFAFAHSFAIGTDVAARLHSLWLFYALLFSLGLLYRLKVFLSGPPLANS
jgi:predicted ferric reductase